MPSSVFLHFFFFTLFFLSAAVVASLYTPSLPLLRLLTETIDSVWLVSTNGIRDTIGFRLNSIVVSVLASAFAREANDSW